MRLKEHSKTFNTALVCKSKIHYFLVKQSSHLYSLILGLIAVNSFALSLDRNCLLGCWGTSKRWGEEAYSNSASTLEQARGFSSKGNPPSPYTWHVRPGGSQCRVSLRPSMLLAQWSSSNPSSCSLFSQISDKFIWLLSSVSCARLFFCPSPSSTIPCNCCLKLRHIPNEAPFLPSVCRHPTPIN